LKDLFGRDILGWTFQSAPKVLVSEQLIWYANNILFILYFILAIRDKTIRELFKNYSAFSNRKPDPDSYDKIINKSCLKIAHNFDEKTNLRSYFLKVQSRFTNYNRLAKLNQDEGCQLLVVKTKHFVPVPYESENLVISSIIKTLSRGFRAYKLKIQFCDQFSNRAGEILIFDPIVSLQLFDWWDLGYEKALNSEM